jgi:N-acetylglucosamine-6-phosphate deacetylase
VRLGVSRAIVDGAVVPGDVDLREGMIAAVGVEPAGSSGTATPGFVDLQVNGFAGVDFLGADAGGYRTAGDALLATGVTAYQPTFISSPPEVYDRALRIAAQAQRDTLAPRLLGVHLEGPFLAPERAGAHDPAHLRAPSVAFAEHLLAAGPVTCMTLAPELPGGLELVEELVRRGVLVSLGHSDADASASHAAFDRGARTVTHLHNAQRRFAARDPGLSGVAQTRADVVVQAIVDGVHLAPETAKLAWLASRGRFALVTDAIAAAGLPDGEYRLGDRQVEKRGLEVRLADGTLAGSVLTMPDAIRNLVGLGAGLPEAVGAATRVPAELIGRPELGRLIPGTPADITILDEDLTVQATYVAGALAFDRASPVEGSST